MHEQEQVPMSPNPSFQKAFSRCLAESGSVSIRLTAFGRGHLIQYVGKSSTFLIVHKRSIALAQASQWPSGLAFVCSELLQDFSETRIKVFHGLERPPKTRLEKNSQRHGPGTLSVWVFEPQYWSEGVWQKTFPALKSFVSYKPWRAVLEAPDGHETNFWQPEKFILVDLESIYFHYTAASFYTNLTQPPAWIIKINFPALQKFYSMGPCHLHVRKLPILLNSQKATSLLTSLILSN